MKSQINLFKDSTYGKGYGGELLKKRKGRIHGRPLDTRNSMHLVLRSSKAVGSWSFKNPQNEAKISRIVTKFAFINGVTIVSMANVGNHLHFQIKLSNRFGYRPFIRAITSAIAMSVTGINRWTKHAMNAKSELTASKKASNLSIQNLRAESRRASNSKMVENNSLTIAHTTGYPDLEFIGKEQVKKGFWDYRPFTRIVKSYQAFLNLRDYIQINVLEGFGCRREEARLIWAQKGKLIPSG